MSDPYLAILFNSRHRRLTQEVDLLRDALAERPTDEDARLVREAKFHSVLSGLESLKAELDHAQAVLDPRGSKDAS